jgi:hypothetical protein
MIQGLHDGLISLVEWLVFSEGTDWSAWNGWKMPAVSGA